MTRLPPNVVVRSGLRPNILNSRGAVAQRAREIGIRMALGGSLRQIRRWVLGNMLVFVAAGLAAGLRAGGTLLAETGEGAVEAARDALQACAVLTEVEVIDDLAGKPRILRARRLD